MIVFSFFQRTLFSNDEAPKAPTPEASDREAVRHEISAAEGAFFAETREYSDFESDRSAVGRPRRVLLNSAEGATTKSSDREAVRFERFFSHNTLVDSNAKRSYIS